jgi:hypothetical protein
MSTATVVAATLLLTLLSAVSVYCALDPFHEQFLRVPNSTESRAHMQYLTSTAHMAGTENCKATAEWTVEQWRTFGLPNVVTQPASVLLSTPVSATVTLNVVGPSPRNFSAKLSEDVVPEVSTCICYRSL